MNRNINNKPDVAARTAARARSRAGPVSEALRSLANEIGAPDPPTRAPDNQLGRMQDQLNHVRKNVYSISGVVVGGSYSIGESPTPSRSQASWQQLQPWRPSWAAAGRVAATQNEGPSSAYEKTRRGGSHHAHTHTLRVNIKALCS